MAEDFYLAPVPNVVPISNNGAAGTSKAYPNEVYPDENVWYIATLPFAPKEIWLRIYPFRYYAHERVLKKLEIHVSLTVKVFTDGMNVLFPHLENNQSVNGQCYDLSGRRLASPPTKGMYIEGGKKKPDFWHFLLYYFMKGKNTTETQKKFCAVYGEGALTKYGL